MKKVVQGGTFLGYLVDETDNEWLTHPNYAAKLMYNIRNTNGNLMDSLISTSDIKEEDINYNIRKPMPILKVITGGNDQPPTGNWLLDLPIGARFTVQSKSDLKNFMCLDLQLCNKTNHTAIVYELSTGLPLGGTNGRVVASRFVSLFDKIEMLETYEDMLERLVKEQEKQVEVTDGPSDRTPQLVPGATPEDLAHAKEPEGRREDHEGSERQ